MGTIGGDGGLIGSIPVRLYVTVFPSMQDVHTSSYLHVFFLLCRLAMNMLKTAPIIPTRGNHEICSRGGFGYFMFMV